MIDLRSDTVTLPTRAMLEAPLSAPLGDDVFVEDPTVKKLEARAAEALGKEAALFFPTATMANLCALLTHAGRGTRVVCGAESHVYCYEAGGASALGGLVYQPLANGPNGELDPAEVAAALTFSEDPHLSYPGVLALENTHNRKGGVILPNGEALAAIAKARGVPVHLDGARLFNAAAARGSPIAALAGWADSVQICLSKGLGAPLGSLLAGTAGFVAKARRMRKTLGGGMRQVGVAAAMGLVAMDAAPRLVDDHRRAVMLHEALRGTFDAIAPQTNILLLRAPFSLLDRAKEEGVLLSTIGNNVRAVTHLGIDDDAIRRAAEAILRAARKIATTS